MRIKNRQKILDLRPTQFAVGMLEVDEKIQIVRDFSKKQLVHFVDETTVPVVISSDGHLYVVDGHHFLCVCYYVGVKKVRVQVVEDLSKKKMSYAQFWTWMFKNRNAYPFCQFGEGPRKALYLPRDIRGVADDPYRSLAWFVRKAGAFENSEKNFAEFKWANFFRKKKLLDGKGIAGMSEAMTKAVELAQSPQARRLPGYGKLKLEEKKIAKKKAKRSGDVIAKNERKI